MVKIGSILGKRLLLLLLVLVAASARGEVYTVEVSQGFGSGSYAPGTEVFIEAFPYEEGDPSRTNLEPPDPEAPMRVFDRWVGDTYAVADVFAARTRLVMPASPVALTATYKNGVRFGAPGVIADIPPAHGGVIFLFHGAGGSAASLFAQEESALFIQEALARSLGVVALDSYDRYEKVWQESPDPGQNLDLQRAAAIRQALIAAGRMTSGDPVYVLGASNGGIMASLFSKSTQTALGFPVAAAAIYISSGNLSVMETTTVPTVFALAERDDANFPAMIAFNDLVSRGVPAQLWVNPHRPVHPGSFWRIDGLALADSEAIYAALVRAGFLDPAGQVLDNPKTSGWEAAIPAAYADFVHEIGDQLKVAYGAHGFISDLNDKVLDFLVHPSTAVTLVPRVSGFDPLSGAPGSFVNIYGDNFVAVEAVTFNGVPADFTLASGSQLQAQVPAGASSGPIAVLNAAGTGTSTEDFVIAGPTITSFSPASGPPGTLVTVDGSGFVDVTEVAIGGVVATIVSGTAYRLSIQVPMGATSGPVSVTNAVGSGVSNADFTVTGPMITSLEPASGYAESVVVINGNGFAAVEEVAFDGLPTEVLYAGTSSLRVRVPIGAQTGLVTVTNYLGTGVSPVDFVVLPPTIASFSPTEGSVGTRVTLSGSGFSGLTAVTFNGVAAEVLSSTATSLRVRVPEGATSGPIMVTTSSGAGQSSANFVVKVK